MLEGLKLRKKLGEGWNKVENNTIEEYGLKLIKGKKTREVYLLRGYELLNNPKCYRVMSHEISRDKRYIIIATGDRVFVKYQGEGSMYELTELEGYHAVYAFTNTAMIFRKEDDYGNHKLLDVNTLKIQNLYSSLSIFLVGMSGIGTEENDGYRYMYMKEGKLCKTDIMEQKFTDDEGCQINKKKSEKGYRLYHLSPEVGILESSELWNEIIEIDDENSEYNSYDFIAKKEGKIFLLKEIAPELVKNENGTFFYNKFELEDI